MKQSIHSMTIHGLLVGGLATLAACTALAAGSDKSLVSWVCLANTSQQGGSALTVQSSDQFDGIVFGENSAGRWMAGSDFFKRSQGKQDANAAEHADAKTLVKLAVVYHGNRIVISRNDEPYASYEANNIDLLSSKNLMAVFGLRHQGAATGQTLQGSIEDARIYDRALNADDIKKLQPKIESPIKPYAWWTFEKGKETDRMGHFPVNNLFGGAHIENGRLVLGSNGAILIASSSKIDGNNVAALGAPPVPLGPAPIPAMPANPPPNWLTYHLIHPGPGGAFPGDPNCAFYWKGKYHLHYIYNHDGVNFAHVSSDDLVHWKWQPTTLTQRIIGHGMFSGTGFFTKEGQPAIIYHGWGSGRNQLAIAQDDKLETWGKSYPLEPKINPGQDGDKIANWDPDAWLDGDNYYALSGGSPGSGKPPTLFKSTDLKNWDYLGLFLDHDMPDVHQGEDVSCPNFFKIGDKYMLLCISHNLGCRYYLGEWKNEKFSPDFHARMTWNGKCFFAPESVLAKDGRRVMWAWLVDLPIEPSGVQSLPRELSLPKDGVLRIKPLKELESLRCDEKQQRDIAVKSDATTKLTKISGNTLELELTIKAPASQECGLDVLCDKDGANGLRVSYIPATKTLLVGNVDAPFELKPGEDLSLRIFIDKNLVEVFANERQAALTARRGYAPENTGISLFSKGADVTVKQLKSWNMKSIYAGQ